MTHRLVLIHGINNQGSSEKALSELWMNVVRRRLGEPTAFHDVNISAPYYGNVLHELEYSAPPMDVVAQGFETLDEDGRRFVESGLGEIAATVGITVQQADKAAEDDATTMGWPVHNRYLIALVSLLETLSPLQGRIAMRLLHQAYVYLNHDWITDAIDKIVGPVLAEDPPKVIVAHSLGTVVAFKLLREMATAGSPRRIPLLLTLGSPFDG
jgi:hypothetical protein